MNSDDKSQCLWENGWRKLLVCQLSWNEWFHPLSSPCLSPPNPSFSGIRKVRKSRYEMLKLRAKCWISAFNAQGSRGIIVAVQVGAVKVYVAAVEALRKKETQGETQETMVFWVSPRPPWMLICTFLQVFFNLTLCMTKLGVLTLSFPDFTDISNTLQISGFGKFSKTHIFHEITGK